MLKVRPPGAVGVLFDHNAFGILIHTVEGRLLAANRWAYQVLGPDPQAWLARTRHDLARALVPGDQVRLVTSEGSTPALSGHQHGDEVEVSVIGPDGRQLWLRLVSTPFDDATEGHLIATSLVDVTAYRVAREALRAQAVTTAEMLRVVNSRHRQQQAIAELGRFALEGTGAQDLMDRACELVATTLEADRVRVMELIPGQRQFLLRAGVGWRDGLVGSAVVPFAGSQAGYLLETNEHLIIEDFRNERRFSWLLREHPVVSGVRAVIRGREHPFGEIGAYTVNARVFTDDDIYFLRGIANTLAEALIRLAASLDLERSVQQLRETDAARRELLRRLANIVEQERSRIARDVHDDALQTLAGLGIRLEVLSERLERPEEKRGVEEIVSSLNRSTERLRQLILDLRPEPLQVGLRSAIRFYFDQTRIEADPELKVRSTLRHELPPEPRLAVYRACQEALNNVRKHAEARHVTVTLDERDGGLAITISDDGKGFRVSAKPHRGHLGLTAMRERAELLGGSFLITSRRGRGTTVRFWFPVADTLLSQEPST